MSDSDVQTIDDKNAQNNSDNSSSSDSSSSGSSNYVGFLVSVILYAILTIIFGVIGANFIYLIRTNNKDKIFPTNLADYFCSEQSGGGKGNRKMKGGNSPKDCAYNPFDTKINPNWDKLFGLDGKMCGWPYSLKKDGVDDKISWESYKNWIASTTAHTFQLNRSLAKKGLSYFNVLNFIPEGCLMILAPIIFSLTQSLIGIWTFFVTIIMGFVDSNKGVLWSLISLFLPFYLLWFMAFGYSVVSTFQSIWITLFVPLLLNRSQIAKTMMCNRGFLGFIFATLVVAAASQNLSSNESMWMTIGYFIMVIKAIYDLIMSK